MSCYFFPILSKMPLFSQFQGPLALVPKRGVRALNLDELLNVSYMLTGRPQQQTECIAMI